MYCLMFFCFILLFCFVKFNRAHLPRIISHIIHYDKLSFSHQNVSIVLWFVPFIGYTKPLYLLLAILGLFFFAIAYTCLGKTTPMSEPAFFFFFCSSPSPLGIVCRRTFLVRRRTKCSSVLFVCTLCLGSVLLLAKGKLKRGRTGGSNHNSRKRGSWYSPFFLELN